MKHKINEDKVVIINSAIEIKIADKQTTKIDFTSEYYN